MTTLEKFVNAFNANSRLIKAQSVDIDKLQNQFSIKLPEEYKHLLLNYGDVSTPGILGIIVEKGLELEDLQEFWDIEQIIHDKTHEWTSNLEDDLIPFAMNSMGSLFCFKTAEIKKENCDPKIYFYDHDFDSLDLVAENFTKFLEGYLNIK